MRIRKHITARDIPFLAVEWKGAKFYVTDMEAEGWQFALSTQTNWRPLSYNDYYYFREPKSRMIIRVKHPRGDSKFYVQADFMTIEKNIPSLWRKERSEEQLLRDDEVEIGVIKDWDKVNKDIAGMDFAYMYEHEFAEEKAVIAKRDNKMLSIGDHAQFFRDMLAGMTVGMLLDEVKKRLPVPKRAKKQRRTAEIINFEDYLQKALKEIA